MGGRHWKEEEISEGLENSYRVDEYVHHLDCGNSYVFCTYFIVSIYGLLYVNYTSVKLFLRKDNGPQNVQNH